MLIYLLIVVNFQSWLDPFVIITALPAALAGIVWMLFATGTTAVGAGADRRDHVHGRGDRQLDPGGQLRPRAAGRPPAMPSSPRVEAGFTRFRPVLMTALAMIIGMAPMALGLGEGGEQNAPLGRAVIGGLIFATCRHPAVRAGGLQHRPRPQGQARRRRRSPAPIRRSLPMRTDAHA